MHLEGHPPLSVAETIQLPDQPASGNYREIPLAGDGYRAPLAMGVVIASQTGDASGGSNSFTVNPDQQHQAMLGWVSVTTNNASADRAALCVWAWEPPYNVQESILLRFEIGRAHV